MSPNIYEGRGDVHGNVPSPNALEVMSFRMSTRVTTRNYVPKESGRRICCILVLEKLKVKNMFSNVDFAARFILSSNSNNCSLLYFNANIMCSFTKKLKLLGDFVPQTPYRGSAPGPRWGTSVPQTPILFLCPPQ